jgi:uncharacterized DUF497 family protein
MSLAFDWDPSKAASNLRKHGVSFEEAASALGDALSIALPDPDHSREEERLLLLGRTTAGRLLIVAFADRGDTLRIFSARVMTSRERRAYEHEI